MIPEFGIKNCLVMNGSILIKIAIIMVTLTYMNLASAEEVIVDRRFGKLTIYKPELSLGESPKSLVLFISGDGGWQYGVINMARFIAREGALVVGINAKSYNTYLAQQSKGCIYPAADFEQLSMFLQRKFGFKSYQKPLLAGYSYGATLVYALLVQAPSGTFSGGIALGFCPDIKLPHPPCKGNGLTFSVLKSSKTYYLNKVKKLSTPFIVLNGVKDQTCDYKATVEFLKDIGNASLVTLPKVGHGFSIADNWLPAFREAYSNILNQQFDTYNITKTLTAQLKTKLPIQFVAANDKSWKHLFFFISGDGGWTSFDQRLAQTFAAKDINIIGLDAQKYFWNKKTPEETAREINNVLIYYLNLYPELKVTLMGYSFGASVIPFIAKRLTLSTFKHVKNMVLLSPDRFGDFEIHVADMLGLQGSRSSYDVVQELIGINSVPKLCIFGSDEDAALMKAFTHRGTVTKVLPRGHHFNDDFQEIVNLSLYLD